MFLIAAGAYITEDFISEIGKLPPAFLPIGNKRLFTYQIDSIRQSGNAIYLSVPEDYRVSAADSIYLQKNKVYLIRVPPGLSLGQSIIYCWNATGKYFASLRILHGDSLFSGLDYSLPDRLSIDTNEGFYRRAVPVAGASGRLVFHNEWVGNNQDVISGYFSFSEPPMLMKGIIESGNDFIDGLSFYAKEKSLEPIRSQEWLDFGHINSFFRSRTAMTTQRAFNDMHITPKYVVKSSGNRKKIQGEANWYESLPDNLKYYMPRLFSNNSDDEVASYKLEYLYLLPLSDLFVHGNLSGSAWNGILSSCKTVLREFKLSLPENSEVLPGMDAIYLSKTISRLHEYFHAGSGKTADGIDEDYLLELAEKSAKFIPAVRRDHLGIVHGDFCFSNILYDNRLQCIRPIDPRGIDSAGNLSIIGDIRYDLAKLYHSMIGLFDLIMADCYALDEEGGIKFHIGEDQKQAQEIFRALFFSDHRELEVEILAINVLLFLAMLPLHGDRPAAQQAMVANAIRLFGDLRTLTR